MTKSILVCFAHPDDEIGCASLINMYSKQGVRTTLICSTNGDVGTVDEKYMQGYSSIAKLRLKELECATQTIGFSDVVTLGYRDSGMMGSADNDHAESSWHAPLEEVTARVVEVMRQVRPQVVITFNTYGAYGHPDHIKINQASVTAFQQLQNEADAPQKLYYVTASKLLYQLGIGWMKLRGRDPRKGGQNADVDYIAAVEAIDPTTTKIATGGNLEVMIRAAKCHASQMGDIPDNLLTRTLGRFLFGTTSLCRVFPKPQPGEPIERDVFQNIAVTTSGDESSKVVKLLHEESPL